MGLLQRATAALFLVCVMVRLQSASAKKHTSVTIRIEFTGICDEATTGVLKKTAATLLVKKTKSRAVKINSAACSNGGHTVDERTIVSCLADI